MKNAHPDASTIPFAPSPVTSEGCEFSSRAVAKPGVATLQIRLRSAENASPLHDIRVWAESSGGAHNVAGDAGWESQSVKTDSEGRAALKVLPAMDLVVNAIDTPWHVTSRSVPALKDGDVVEILMTVPARAGLPVHGRLVDAETGESILGRVLVEQRDGSITIIDTDLTGNFELPVDPQCWWVIDAAAEATGYSPDSFGIRTEPTDAARPLIVRLARASVVDVLVRGRAGDPVAGASVEVEYATAQRATQRAATIRNYIAITGANGAATISNLPANVALRVSFSAPGEAKQYSPYPLVLTPAERRRIELLVGPGTTIVGRLEDEVGVVIPWCTVWRTLADGQSSGTFRSGDRPIQATKTDADGFFRFEAVPPGDWWIGPAPGAAHGIPPIAELVSLHSPVPKIEILVRVNRRE